MLLATLAVSGCDSPLSPNARELALCIDHGGWIIVRDEGPSGIARLGKWTLVPAGSRNTFRFEAPERMAIAFGRQQTPIASSLTVYHLTRDELSLLECRSEAVIGDMRTYSGTVGGMPLGATAQVWMGGGAAFSPGNGSFALTGTKRPADLIAMMNTGVVDRMIVRRNVDLPDGATLPTLDFTSSEAAAPRTASFTFIGAGGARLFVDYTVDLKGTRAGIPFTLNQSTASLPALAVTQQQPEDRYNVLVATEIVAGMFKLAGIRFSNPGDRTVVFGPDLAAPAMRFGSTSGASSVRAAFPVQADYGDFVAADFTQQQPAYTLTVNVIMTRRFRGTGATWEIETPDPSIFVARSVSFDPAYAVDWNFRAWSGDPFFHSDSIPLETVQRLATRGGSFRITP